MTDPDTILLEAEDAMEKAESYLKHEFRGIRTGRASTALVDYIKVDYYGSTTDLKSMASISIPEATQILIKPFDAGCVEDVRKAIETSGLNLNPMVEGKQIRLNIPPLSRERRQQLVGHCKKLGEEFTKEYSRFFNCSVVRFAAVYSDWCEYAPLYKFLETWLEKTINSKILGGKGESAITYIHIFDLPKLLCKIIRKKSSDGRTISTEYSEGCTREHLKSERETKKQKEDVDVEIED